MKLKYLIVLVLAMFVMTGYALENQSQITGQLAEKSTTVYKTKTGKKYHKSGCRYLKKSKIKTTLKEAKQLGLTACKVCKP